MTSIFLDLVDPERKLSVDEIDDRLEELSENDDVSYGDLLISLADLYGTELSKSDIPEEAFERNANIESARETLSGKAGSLTLQETLQLFGIIIHE